MYCKNCGKYLEEGTRFCDRCGQSVRKSANSEQAVRHQNIEELKEERLNRKKRLEELEAREAMKNKRKQKRRKKNRGTTAFILVVLMLAVVAIILSYSITRCSSEKKNNAGNGEVMATQTPSVSGMTGSNAASTMQPQSPQTSAAPVAADGEYRVFEINNVVCPYPADFSKKAVSDKEKLSLVDSVGGGVMAISQEQDVSDTPAEMMKDFARNMGVSPSYSLADKTSYTITAEKSNTVYHRKCIISGTTAIYYDFQYSSMSSSRARYEQCVAYIDSNMGVK